MPKIPGVSSADAIRVFEKLGYRVVRRSKHINMSNGIQHLVIPHGSPINAYTMGTIARIAGLTPDQFRAML